jgi:hypothetical protein
LWSSRKHRSRSEMWTSHQLHQKKRTSALNDLRSKYIGRIIELSGVSLFRKSDDNNTYKLQVWRCIVEGPNVARWPGCHISMSRTQPLHWKIAQCQDFGSFWTTRTRMSTRMNKEFTIWHYRARRARTRWWEKNRPEGLDRTDKFTKLRVIINTT